MRDRITGAKALMRALQAEGVKTIFGYPGGAIMPVYDALFDYTRGEKKCFDHILVRHEQAATHAAEGYARVSGEVGVALVTSGPGATNTMTGVADAMMDSTPMVVIAGQVPISALGSDAFQEVDLVGVAQPISKWSYQIRRAEDIAWAVSRAFFIARSGRPGPVVLDFSRNAQVEEVEWEPKKVDFVRSYVPYPQLDPEAVRQAADLINNARQPLALVGQGVELGNAQEELREFLEKADIPAGRTMLGLSALPSNHPLNVGMLGMHGNYAVNLKEQECDVLIAIGMRFSDRVTGNLKTYARQAKIIHLDIDRSEIDKNVKTDVAVVADCKESLPAITALLYKNKHQKWRDSFRELDEKERVKVIQPAIHPTSGPLLMGEVVNGVAEQAPDDTVLVTDVGQNQLFATRYFKFHHQRSLCTSGGLGTMGFGYGAAIGTKFGVPEAKVIHITGDGSFHMNMNEACTAVSNDLQVITVIMDNKVLGMVHQWQNLFFNQHYMETEPGRRTDYKKVIEGFGGHGFEGDTPENFRKALEEALTIQGPSWIRCPIDPDEFVLPMIPAGKTVEDIVVSEEDLY